MKGKKQFDIIKPEAPPKQATLEFTLEELYMLVGSVASFRNYLQNGVGTRAHEIRASEYHALLQRLDREYASLSYRQRGEAISPG